MRGLRPRKEITLSCRVDPYREGWTLVDFLAHRFRYHPRRVWENRIREGRVAVNDQPASPNLVVTGGDLVSYTILHSEPEVDFRYRVVYEDDHLLAVSKSGNLPVHACGVYITHTLIAKLKEDLGPGLNLAHRLDRETSGLVLLSKSKEVARALGLMFSRGEVEKRYIALCHGYIWQHEFEVSAPVARVSEQSGIGGGEGKANLIPKRRVHPRAGKPARTLFKVIRRFLGLSLLEARPLTGRTNQIRVHLALIGHPIVGDKVYGLSEGFKEQLLAGQKSARLQAALLMDRHALHCSSLSLAHPATGSRLTLEAPLPEDMQAFVDAAR